MPQSNQIANGRFTDAVYGGDVKLAVIALAALSLAAAASASSSYSDSFTGTEIIPVSSVRGTFVGVARGGLPAVWRSQIVHERLSSGTTVAVTGGSFSILARSG